MGRGRNQHSIVIQARDIAILKELVESRAVAVRHIARLYFEESEGAAHKRLRALRHAGWVSTRPGTPGSPGLLQLTREGYQRLAGYEPPAFSWPQVHRRQRVSGSVLQHELAVMDTKCALARTARLMRFTTIRPDRYLDARLRGPGSGLPMPYPDAYLQLKTDRGIDHFFMELDNGTQRLSTIQQKVQAYRKTACLDLPMGAGLQRARTATTVPFRILFVCLSHRRRDSLASCMLKMKPPVRRFCVLALLSDLNEARVEERWITPDML